MGGYCFHHDGQRVVVRVRGQVLRAEIDDTASWFEPRPTGDDGDPAGAIRLLEPGASWAAPIYASVHDAGLTPDFTPLFAMVAKAKAFDDRLYARVERLVHDGVAEHPALYGWLEALRAGFETGTAMRGFFDAAAHLAGAPLPEAGQPKYHARKWLSTFTGNAAKSRPTGFYADDDELSRIFRHDRFLQTELSAEQAAAIRAQLSANPAVLESYEGHLRFISRLTCPFPTAPGAAKSVLDPDAEAYALVPPSDSSEGRLIRALYGDRPIPESFELGRALVERIRGGELVTEPRENDGWYARQFHANAALLRPETEGLEIGPRYRDELEQTFQALFALNRETHTKQLETPSAGGRPLIISPRLSIEPVPLFFERTAAAYAFVRGVLEAHFGRHVTSSASIAVEGASIHDALLEMEALFSGAALVSRTELGQEVEATPADELAAASFRRWQSTSASDPDLAHDNRVAVPVYYDIERRTHRICATIGVETRTLRVEFVEQPSVEVLGSSASPFGDAEPIFTPRSFQILAPITVEADVTTVPTRDELRAICDAHDSTERIRDALVSL